MEGFEEATFLLYKTDDVFLGYRLSVNPDVLQTIEKRVGAKLVPEMMENITAPEQYELLEMSKISGFINRAKGTGRPTKKDRRELEDFTAPEFVDDFDFDFDFEE